MVNGTATAGIYGLGLHEGVPVWGRGRRVCVCEGKGSMSVGECGDGVEE